MNYRHKIIPVKAGFHYINLVNGHILKKTGKGFCDTGNNIQVSYPFKHCYLDVYGYSTRFKRLYYEVYELSKIAPERGGILKLIFHCYWHLNSRIRYETGMKSYEYWKDENNIIHNSIEYSDRICDAEKVVNELLNNEGIRVYSKTFDGIVNGCSIFFFFSFF